MTTSLTRRQFALVALSLFVPAGCHYFSQMSNKPDLAAMPDITPTRLDYVDTDGFDAVLENALVNQDPVIVVRTRRSRPDWDGRLNAWIAAWNRGGSGRPRGARRASPRPLSTRTPCASCACSSTACSTESRRPPRPARRGTPTTANSRAVSPC